MKSATMSEKAPLEGVSGSTSADAAARLTPDGQVAQRIVKRLIVEGLIEQAHAEEIWVSLTEGTARSADWRFLAQSSLAEEQYNATGAN